MFNIVKKMLDRFKGSPKEKPVIVEQYNYTLIHRLTDIVYTEEFKTIFNSSANKILLLSVYSLSLSDLMNNLVSRNLNRSLAAISVYDFLENNHHDLQRQFKRVLEILPDYKISPLIEHDLNELCDTYDYLKTIKG